MQIAEKSNGKGITQANRHICINSRGGWRSPHSHRRRTASGDSCNAPSSRAAWRDRALRRLLPGAAGRHIRRRVRAGRGARPAQGVRREDLPHVANTGGEDATATVDFGAGMADAITGERFAGLKTLDLSPWDFRSFISTPTVSVRAAEPLPQNTFSAIMSPTQGNASHCHSASGWARATGPQAWENTSL